MNTSLLDAFACFKSPPSTLTRGSSEQGPADRLDHAPLQISHSFPYTADIRGESIQTLPPVD